MWGANYGYEQQLPQEKVFSFMSGNQGYRFCAAGFRRSDDLRVFPPAKGLADPPWCHSDHLRLCSDETLNRIAANERHARHTRKRAVVMTALVCFLWLKGTVYFVGSDASCAYVRFSNCTVLVSDSDRLNVSVPFSSCTSYGVRNVVSGRLSFSANFTFSWHLPHLL